MFESLGQVHRRDLSKRVASLLTSVLAHAAVFLIFVILPMVFFNVLPETELLTIVIAAPVAPTAPPPPRPPVDLIRAPSSPRPTVTENTFVEPSTIPASIPPPEDDSQTAYLSQGASSGESTVPGAAWSNPAGRSSLADMLGGSASPPPPPPPPQSKPRIRVGGKVQESKLVHRVDPAYPELARRAHISATVVLQIDVDEEGNVNEVKVLAGHPLFNAAAVSAVMQWKYSPTLLNGEPVPVTASVTVVFTLR